MTHIPETDAEIAQTFGIPPSSVTPELRKRIAQLSAQFDAQAPAQDVSPQIPALEPASVPLAPPVSVGPVPAQRFRPLMDVNDPNAVNDVPPIPDDGPYYDMASIATPPPMQSPAANGSWIRSPEDARRMRAEMSPEQIARQYQDEVDSAERLRHRQEMEWYVGNGMRPPTPVEARPVRQYAVPPIPRARMFKSGENIINADTGQVVYKGTPKPAAIPKITPYDSARLDVAKAGLVSARKAFDLATREMVKNPKSSEALIAREAAMADLEKAEADLKKFATKVPSLAVAPALEKPVDAPLVTTQPQTNRYVWNGALVPK